MKYIPIFFKGPMVRAILNGSKTQTRRPLLYTPKNRIIEVDGKFFDADGINPGIEIKHNFGTVGDRLWVRETWTRNNVLPISDRPKGYFIYRADLADDGKEKWSATWKPSIHMPRIACRIVLEITDVRIERVQDISEKDAWKEGCPEAYIPDKFPRSDVWFYDTWQDCYPGSWKRNDLVFVRDFKVVEVKA